MHSRYLPTINLSGREIDGKECCIPEKTSYTRTSSWRNKSIHTYLVPFSERTLPYMGCCLSPWRLLLHACDVLISSTCDVARGSVRGKLKRLTNGPNFKRKHFKMNGGIQIGFKCGVEEFKCNHWQFAFGDWRMPINLNRQLFRYLRPGPSDNERHTDSRGKVFISIVGEWRRSVAFSKIAVCSSFDGRTRPIKRLLKVPSKYCDTLGRAWTKRSFTCHQAEATSMIEIALIYLILYASCFDCSSS